MPSHLEGAHENERSPAPQARDGSPMALPGLTPPARPVPPPSPMQSPALSIGRLHWSALAAPAWGSWPSGQGNFPNREAEVLLGSLPKRPCAPSCSKLLPRQQPHPRRPAPGLVRGTPQPLTTQPAHPEVGQGCVMVAVGGGQHVQGEIEVDTVAGGVSVLVSLISEGPHGSTASSCSKPDSVRTITHPSPASLGRERDKPRIRRPVASFRRDVHRSAASARAWTSRVSAVRRAMIVGAIKRR